MALAIDDRFLVSSFDVSMLASVMEHSDDFVAIGTPIGPTLWANNAALRFLGRTREEMLAGKFSPMHTHSPASREQLRTVGAPIAIRDGVWRGESVFIRHDGQERIMSQTLIAHRNAQGIFSYFSTIARDITDTKRTHQALEKSLAALQEAQTLARLGSWELNLITGECAWSAGLFRLFAFDPAGGAPGREGFALRIHPDDLAAFRGCHDKVAAHGHSELIHRIVLPGGETRVLHTRSTAVRDAAGNRIGTRGTSQDVTESQQAEQQLIAAREEALQASRAKSQFLANMSHEIRTPLNSVLGMTALALDTPLTPEQHDYLSTAHSSGQALLGMLDDLLDLSKIEAGRLELERIPFDPREVLEGAGRLLSEQASEKGLELVIHLDAELPSQTLGDPGRLRQVVLNLLGNAIKFTPSGEVVLRVCRGEGELVCFEVRDTGVGIAPEKQAQIFDPFTQADGSTTRKYGGTGLGLTISRQLVEKMGGRLEVDSQLGRGSIFRFTVPFPCLAAARPVLAGKVILVVEPHGASRAAIEQALRAAGASPELARSAEEARQRLAILRVAGASLACIVLAHRPPVLDALALVTSLRPALGGAQVLVLTSPRERPTVAAQAAAGAPRLLLRPAPLRELIDASVGPPAMGSRTLRSPSPPRRLAASGLAVLVAEDNPISAKLATRLLEKLGHVPRAVASGQEALDLLSTGSFPLALMDVQLPDLDGLEVTRRLRDLETLSGRHTIVVALTASVLAGDTERCLVAGMDACLEKPVTMADLRDTLGGLTG
jgi:PAS domain S-box-containing protein